NISDVLTLPPMLLEKYLAAANKVVTKAVPTIPAAPQEQTIPGRRFSGGESASEPPLNRRFGGLALSYYTAAAVSDTFRSKSGGNYQLALDLMVNEKFVDDLFDYNKCRVVFKVDGNGVLTNEYSWEGGKPYHYELDRRWNAGDHELAFELTPLTPNEK